MDVDGAQNEADELPSIVVETSRECFLITARPGDVDADDKENAATPVVARRYTVALLSLVTPEDEPEVVDPVDVGSSPPRESEKPANSKPSQSSKSSDAAEGTPPKSDTNASKADPPVNGIKEKLLSLGLPDKSAADAKDKGPAKGKGEETKESRASSSEAKESDMSISPAESRTPVVEAKEDQASAEGKKGGEAAAQPTADATKKDVEVTKAASTEKESDESAAMDVEKPTPLATASKVAARSITKSKPSKKPIPEIQVLHRNLNEDDLVFDADGISILVGEPLNGMRNGWKIEAKSWRWASGEVLKVV